MPSIHYRFRSGIETKVVTFNGSTVPVTELNDLICAAEKINTDLFQLKLLNVHNVEYNPSSQIPSNSTVIVQRVPATNGKKIPKISNREEHSHALTSKSIPQNVAHINATDFSKLTEYDRIRHAMRQSTYKYDPSMYSKKPMKNHRVAPESFRCNRCHQFGHFMQDCPLKNIRRTTGMIAGNLVDTTADDPDRLLHSDGRWVVHKMVLKAREQQKMRNEQKQRQQMGVTVATTTTKMPKVKSTSVPEELQCSICHLVFREAVTLRCGDSFCADCILKKIEAEEKAERLCCCPQCRKFIGVHDVIPNKALREASKAFVAKNPESVPQINDESSLRGNCAPSTSLFEPSVDSKQQPPEVDSSLLPINACAASSHSTKRRSPMKLGRRDKASIDSAWSLVPQFDGEVDISELLTKDHQHMPKLVWDDEKENQHSFRKRSHSIGNSNHNNVPRKKAFYQRRYFNV